MSGLDVYREVVSDADPERCLAELTNDELEDLIESLWLIDNPNDFQARVFALAMVRVLVRWKQNNRQTATL